MLSDNLIAEMGLLKLQSKTSITLHSERLIKSEPNPQPKTSETSTPVQAQEADPNETKKMDKSEFRLLVKMLHAINHECQYECIHYDGQAVSYQHPKKTLVFNDINSPDSGDIMNLSSLTDILDNSALKRPVWEKLKTL